MEFVIGGLAAVSAGFFTNPLEVLKTRIQLQGELKAKGKHAVHYKNIFHAGYVVVKNDGIWALQSGLQPALWVQLVLNGLRLGAFQYAHSKGLVTDSNGNIIFYRNVLASGSAGAFGQFCCGPFYLVKTHLQAQAVANIAVGHQHNHEGTWRGLAKIHNEQGIKGLFRGAGASLPRGFVGSSSQLMAFTYSKELLRKHNLFEDWPLFNSFLASMIGGVAISVAMTPFDLVLTRICNQGVDAQGRGLLYKNYSDCVLKIFQTEGFFGFYKGLMPNYLRLGPHTVLCLVFWDLFKDIYEKRFTAIKQ